MNAMEDLSSIVLDQADRLFQQHVSKAILSDAENGKWSASLWAAMEQAGLPMAFVPEDQGGVGLSADVVGNLIRRAAFYSVPLPLAETMIANRLWADAGGEAAGDATTLSPFNPHDRAIITHSAGSAVLSGIMHHVPWGTQVRTSLSYASDADGKGFLCRVPLAGAKIGKSQRNVAYEPRVRIQFDGCVLADADVRPAPDYLKADGLIGFAAAIRVQQMIGGMERCMEYALTYANDRQQFGRPIGKFQAIQHMLAIAAGHFAAACATADALFESERLGDDPLAVAIAKSRCGEAAGKVAAITHQVHGAMGFTQEHPLHFATRRLWAWRDEGGAEPYWEEKIGRLICESGGEQFWRHIAGRS
jgi:acyl-CoA dehydrogenase